MSSRLKIAKILTFFILFSIFIIIFLDILNSEQSQIIKLVKQINPNEEVLQNNETDFGEVELVAEYINREPSIDELTNEFEKQLPNVPFAYSLNYNHQSRLKNYKCALFPDLKTLNYYNDYWQTYSIKNITMQLFGAYYDDRLEVGNGTGVVRILAMINQITAPFPITYCQIWFENDRKPLITKISIFKLIWYARWGKSAIYYPYLMTCDLAKVTTNTNAKRIPKAVTIVEHECDKAKNALKVIYEKPTEGENKMPFAICVKGLDFPYADISQRLVEWLEMQRLLGVHKVYFHNIAIHPNVTKILDYYQHQGFVEVQPISSVNGLVGMPHLQHWLVKPTLLIKRLNELIPYNECFYRNMYKCDYIVLIDIDEIIMPLGNLTTWHDLVAEAKQNEKLKKCSQGFASLCARNIYFPYSKENYTILQSEDDKNSLVVPELSAPSHMFMLNRQYRIKHHQRAGYNTKCLHNTSQALTLHNHYPMSWLTSCRSLDLSNTSAQLQHYHDVQPNKDFSELVLDRNIERFRNSLIDKTTNVLKILELLP